MSIDTKLGKVVTYHEGLLPLTLRDPSITLSPEVTWRIKYGKLHLN